MLAAVGNFIFKRQTLSPILQAFINEVILTESRATRLSKDYISMSLQDQIMAFKSQSVEN